jgi:flagellar basal-body rod protein FlgB
MNIDEVFGIHAQALTLRSRRAEVIAGNLANADTPGYKARDFDFHKVLNQEIEGSVKVRATSQGHIQPDAGLISPAQLLYRTPMQPSLDGNTVDTEQEHTSFSANAMEYQASLSFINGKISSLRKAIRGD